MKIVVKTNRSWNTIKKAISLFSIFTFSFAIPFLFAQIPAAGPGTVAIPVGLETVGIVAAVSGKVELITPGQVGRIAQSGQKVFMSDEIKTDSQGHLQILLLDETVFTIGPDSSIIIDEFIYDPRTQDGKMKASIAKGVFRYVSGKIAAKKPSNVTIKFPTSTMGIRGTIVAGQVFLNGSTLAALLGPGVRNDAGAKIGSFIMQGTGQHSGQSQEVNRTGFGVTVGVDGNISGAFQLSGVEINNLTTGLLFSAGQTGQSDQDTGQPGQPGTPPPPGQLPPLPGTVRPPPGTLFSGDKKSVGTISGETRVITRETINTVKALNNISSDLDWQSQQVAQDSAVTSNAVANGITTAYDLARIRTGIGHYVFSGVPFSQTYPSPGTGSLSGSIEINFGQRTIGGGGSYTAVTGTGYCNYSNAAVGVHSFNEIGTGQAIFVDRNIAAVSGAVIKTEVTLGNTGGMVANVARVQVNYNSLSARGEGSTIVPFKPE